MLTIVDTSTTIIHAVDSTQMYFIYVYIYIYVFLSGQTKIQPFLQAIKTSINKVSMGFWTA